MIDALQNKDTGSVFPVIGRDYVNDFVLGMRFFTVGKSPNPNKFTVIGGRIRVEGDKGGPINIVGRVLEAYPAFPIHGKSGSHCSSTLLLSLPCPPIREAVATELEDHSILPHLYKALLKVIPTIDYVMEADEFSKFYTQEILNLFPSQGEHSSVEEVHYGEVEVNEPEATNEVHLATEYLH